ncbi:MAG: ArdC-like ssDNA-binding domain-containing protein [Pirellulaceae bacterium]
MNRDEALQASDVSLHDLATQLRAGKSDQLVQYLNLLAMFHSYSFGNLMLIASQKPAATMVAGFSRWRQLGRFVKKGEKGIAILAPLVLRRGLTSSTPKQTTSPGDRSATSPPEPVPVLCGFRVVYVFDVSQTDGAELPAFASVAGDPGRKLQLLQELVTEEGITLHILPELPRGCLGMSQGGTITIAAHLPPASMFATLAHELAHEKLHWNDQREQTTRQTRETEAEAVAYVVCRAMGLDCSTQSSDYIQLYSGDDKVLLKSLERIRSTAAWMIERLTKLDAEYQPKSEEQSAMAESSRSTDWEDSLQSPVAEGQLAGVTPAAQHAAVSFLPDPSGSTRPRSS